MSRQRKDGITIISVTINSCPQPGMEHFVPGINEIMLVSYCNLQWAARTGGTDTHRSAQRASMGGSSPHP